MNNRGVVITGASRGIGRALVEYCLAEGDRVFPLVRNSAQAEELLADSDGRCRPIVCDLGADPIEERIGAVLTEADTAIDLLINNAGQGGRGLRLQTLDPQVLRDLFEVHCVAALRVSRAVVPFMAKASSPTIVNISSRYGSLQRTASGMYNAQDVTYAYRIAKAAQNMATVSMQQELRHRGIKVLAIHPGSVRTHSGEKTATMEADEAAELIFELLMSQDALPEGSFVEPGAGLIPW